MILLFSSFYSFKACYYKIKIVQIFTLKLYLSYIYNSSLTLKVCLFVVLAKKLTIIIHVSKHHLSMLNQLNKKQQKNTTKIKDKVKKNLNKLNYCVFFLHQKQKHIALHLCGVKSNAVEKKEKCIFHSGFDIKVMMWVTY